MKSEYDVIYCFACGNKMVLEDGDTELVRIICPVCGYPNEFSDPNTKVVIEEW